MPPGPGMLTDWDLHFWILEACMGGYTLKWIRFLRDLGNAAFWPYRATAIQRYSRSVPSLPCFYMMVFFSDY